MTEVRRSRGVPAHVGVLLGLSAGAYAAVLTGVTASQSAIEAARIAERAPIEAGLSALAASHNRLDAALGQARDRYATAAAEYADLAPGIAGLESDIADLSGLVAQIQGTAAALPAGAPMPAIRTSVAAVAAPPVHAVTGASGG